MAAQDPLKLPSIPDAVSDQTEFNSAIKEIIEVREGRRPKRPLEKNVTFRDLIASGIASYDGNLFGYGGGTTLVPVGGLPDLSVPPRPENLVAVGGLGIIILSWDHHGYGNHAYTEVWRADVDDLGQAVKIGTSISLIYVDSLGDGVTKYYWIRFVSTANVEGPYNDSAGTEGETSLDPGYVKDVLAGAITESELHADLNERIDLIDEEGGALDRISDLEATVPSLDTRLSGQIAVAVNDIARVEAELGEASLELIMSVEETYSELADNDYEFGNFRDAISYVDPEEGEIKLYAVDALTTDVNTRLNQVSVDLDAAEAQIQLKVNSTEFSAVDGRLTVAESTITQQAASINLKASVTYVDDAISGVLAGFQPVYAWEFNGTVESWTGSGATLTAGASSVAFESTSTTPRMDRASLEYIGTDYPLINILVRRDAGSGWDGRIYYATDGHAAFDTGSTYAVDDVVIYSGDVWVCHTAVGTSGAWTGATNWTQKATAHGFSDSYYKSITEISDDGNFHVISTSMRTLTAGGTDYEDTVISGIRIQLGNTSSDDFTVERVEIGKSSIEQLLFNDLEARLATAEIDIDANEAAINLKASQLEVDGIDARLSSAEVDINANEAAILLRATQADFVALEDDVTVLTSRVSTAEIDIDANASAVALKASQVEVDDHEARISTAEVTIDAQEKKIVQSVIDSSVPSEVVAEALLESVLTDDAQYKVDQDVAQRIAAAETTLSATQDEQQSLAMNQLVLQAKIDSAEGNINSTSAFVISQQQALATQQEASASSITALSARVDTAESDITNNAAAIVSEQSVRATADSAMASDIVTLQATATSLDGRVGAAEGDIITNSAAISNESVVRASADSAMASDILTLQTTVNGNTTSIQTNATAINGIEAQYTVKIDNNGFVSGFGLASTPVDDVPFSEFIINADRFAITLPNSEWQDNTVYTIGKYVRPTVGNETSYIYRCTVGGTSSGTEPSWPTTIGQNVTDGGVTWVCADPQESVPFVAGQVNGVPSLVFGQSYFGDATITSAAIESLVATKLYAESGTIADIVIGSGHITNLMIGNFIQSDNFSLSPPAGWKLDKSGSFVCQDITIYDSAGGVILTSGGTLANTIANSQQQWSDVSGSGKPSDNADVTSANTAAAIAGQGNFATLNQINSSNISTYIANASIDTLRIQGDAVTVPTHYIRHGRSTIPSDALYYNLHNTQVTVNYDPALGGKHILLFSFIMSNQVSGTQTFFYYVERNNTTNVFPGNDLAFVAYTNTYMWEKAITYVGIDPSPLSGANSYRVVGRAAQGSGPNIYIDMPSILVLGAKR